MLKSDYSMTGIVSPVFQEPWGINTTGRVEFKGKSRHGYLYILKNLKKSLSQEAPDTQDSWLSLIKAESVYFQVRK